MGGSPPHRRCCRQRPAQQQIVVVARCWAAAAVACVCIHSATTPPPFRRILFSTHPLGQPRHLWGHLPTTITTSPLLLPLISSTSAPRQSSRSPRRCCTAGMSCLGRACCEMSLSLTLASARLSKGRRRCVREGSCKARPCCRRSTTLILEKRKELLYPQHHM